MSSFRDNRLVRIFLIVLSQLAFAATLIINGLAGPGKGPFQRSTGNVSWSYETEITPAGWTFSIWALIYSWLMLMNIYILTWFCRGLYSSPALLPSEFFLSWIFNMILNSSWLVLWDNEMMTSALVVLALIAFTNYLLIFFSCAGLRDHGSWLKQNHPKDLLCVIILVQNGVAIYATWTTIATLLNMTIVLNLASVSSTNAATASLCVLLLEVIIWFSAENFAIEKHVRNILTIYPVIIYALIGSISKNYDTEAPSRNSVFTVILLVVTCIVLPVRVGLVVWRHKKQPLFTAVGAEVRMPLNFGTNA